ncbi:MAG: hypothetical protein KGR26_00820 [Cyanobacteria bacterium REEB65]|nr:hypothetical protein [Cyanobacteria bacterium REEB65]
MSVQGVRGTRMLTLPQQGASSPAAPTAAPPASAGPGASSSDPQNPATSQLTLETEIGAGLGALSAGAGFVGSGSKAQGLGSLISALAGVFGVATGNQEVATKANDVGDVATAATKLQGSFAGITKLVSTESSTGASAASTIAKDAGQGLSSAAKIGNVANLARAGLSGVQLAQQIEDAIQDPSRLSDPKFQITLAQNVLNVANGAASVFNLLGKSGLAKELNPVLGIASDVTGITKDIEDIQQNGWTAQNGLDLASNAVDLAGNALGPFTPQGAALKGVAMGLQVAELAVKHSKEIEGALSSVATTVESDAQSVGSDIATGLGNLASAFSSW